MRGFLLLHSFLLHLRLGRNYGYIKSIIILTVYIFAGLVY